MTDEFQSSYRQRSVVAKPEETKMTITQPDQPEVKETSLDRHFDKPQEQDYKSTYELFSRKRDEKPRSFKNNYIKISEGKTSSNKENDKVEPPIQHATVESQKSKSKSIDRSSKTYVSRPVSEGQAPVLSSIKSQMKRSQQKQDELLQQMLDKPASISGGSRPQRQSVKDFASQNAMRSNTIDSDNDKPPVVDSQVGETLQSYHESEVSEIRMFNNFPDTKAKRQRDSVKKSMQNPYMKQSQARPERIQKAPEPVPVKKGSAGRISEQSEISFVEDGVDALPKERSVGASSKGIRPYSRGKRDSSKDRSDRRQVSVENILASMPNQKATDDDDSFAFNVKRIPGSSAKQQSAYKSQTLRREDLSSIPDQDESQSFQINMNTVENIETIPDVKQHQRDKFSTFNQSPITQGIASSADLTPGQNSFGFDIQQVKQESPSNNNDLSNQGLGKLIEDMDQDQLKHSYGRSSEKSVAQRAAEKMKRQQSMRSSKDDLEENSSKSKERRHQDTLPRHKRHSDINDEQSIVEVSVLTPGKGRNQDSPQQEDTGKSGGSHFKNQYLSSRNSGTPAKQQSEQNREKNSDPYMSLNSSKPPLADRTTFSNPYIADSPKGIDESYGRQPHTPHLGESKPHHSFVAPEASGPDQINHRNSDAFHHKNSAPSATKKPSKTSRANDYSHIQSRLAPSTRAKQKRPRAARKKAGQRDDYHDPEESANYGEEGADFVPMDELHGSFVHPNSKGSQRYGGAPDNTSNRNTATRTDGTISEAQVGFSGRGIGQVSPFKGSLKKSKQSFNKTDRPAIKEKERDSFGNRYYEPQVDQDEMSAGPARSSGNGSRQKSASYQNLTASFKNKIDPPQIVYQYQGRNQPSNSFQGSKSRLSGQRSQPDLRSSGGRQPTQKKKALPLNPQNLNDADLARYKANQASQEKRARRDKTPESVYARLSDPDRRSSCDRHCHHKHPDHWKWHKDAPNSPYVAARSRSNSRSPNTPQSYVPAQDEPEGFKITVVPMENQKGLSNRRR